MTEFEKKFWPWLHGFNHSKEKYPAPWDTADTFPASRAVEDLEKIAPSLAGVDCKMGRTLIYALRALKSGEHYVAVQGKNILVEYHSHESGKIEFVRFDYEELALDALAIRESELEDADEMLPISFIKSESGFSSGTAVYMAIFLGFLAHTMDDTGKFGVDLSATLVNSLMEVSEENEVSPDNIKLFAAVVNLFYLATRPTRTDSSGKGWLGAEFKGISPTDAVINKVYIGDVQESAEKSVPLNKSVLMREPTLASIIHKCRFLDTTETKFFDSLEVKDDESTMRSSIETKSGDAIMEKLKKELKLDIHKLSEYEKDLVPIIPASYVVDEQLLKVARLLKRDWKRPGIDLAPNVILEGDSGSGKTAGSKWLAGIFGVPYTKITMNPTFESANLIGAFYPVFTDIDDWDIEETDRAAIDAIKGMMESIKLSESSAPSSTDIVAQLKAAFTSDKVRETLRESYGIPFDIDCQIDPQDAWLRLGHGEDEPVPVVEEIITEATACFETKAFNLMNIICEQEKSGGVSYRFILSELMRAFQNGWLVEIQEAKCVLRPGVLTELNSLLELGGRIELPNGQFIKRHPDTIVVVTTNRNYAGNVDLNESFKDRCVLGVKMDLPPAKVMAERAMMQTGWKEKPDVVLTAAETIRAIAEEAKSKNINGAFAMRSLLGWTMDLQAGDYSEDTFKMRVLWKMVTEDDDVNLLMTCYRANCKFASKVGMGKERRV